MGGQSAFGTKAGDVFTKITVGTAVVWILLCIIAISIFTPPKRPGPDSPSTITTTDPVDGDQDQDATGDDEEEHDRDPQRVF